MIERDTLYTYSAPEGTISDFGIAEILRLLQRQNLRRDNWAALNPQNQRMFLPELPAEWSWQWVVTGRANYTGTFPKRIRKYYFKNFGLKMPEALLAELGNIARAHASEAVTYRFEFVDTFDWEDGDFGDAGSCYWGENSGARDMLADNDALAIRFYNEDGSGLARAWVAPIDTDLYIVFNGYGFPGHATLTIARVMAAHFGLAYRKIALSNDGTTSGLLWINGGAGYIVGTPDVADGFTDYDFNWPDHYSDYCYSCGTRIHGDDYYHGADDEMYCVDCYYNRFEDCYRCGSCEWREDVTYVDDDPICPTCLRRHYTACASCDEYRPNEILHTTEDGRQLCANCYEELIE